MSQTLANQPSRRQEPASAGPGRADAGRRGIAVQDQESSGAGSARTLHRPGRYFLVGSVRSGTTLLQCLLTAHSQVFSLPETQFFFWLPARQKRRDLLGLAGEAAPHWYRNFLEVAKPPASLRLPQRPMFVRQYARAFVSAMDALAAETGKSVWLEKTPYHVRRIEEIERLVPGARFIHIVRSGADAIASHYDAMLKYPHAWSEREGLARCVQDWVNDVRHTLRYCGSPNHCVTGYSELTRNTECVLRRLCDFLRLNFESSMLDEYKSALGGVRDDKEPWKDGVAQSISSRDGTKFKSILTAEQQAYVLEAISAVDLSPLRLDQNAEQ